ncbi:hypothetical protein ROZALSC1DRAFT_29457, partial [Rozella allomycis CSF55]
MKYGYHYCDTNINLLHDTLNALNGSSNLVNQTKLDIDLLLVTGDTVRHNSDPNIPLTVDEILQTSQFVMRKLKESLPKSIILPAVGNNDLFIHDILDKGPNANLKGLYESYELLTGFSDYKDTFLKGGYYTYQTKNMNLIVLNTNYFVLANSIHADCGRGTPGHHQLTYLKDQIASAKSRHQAVFIAGHHSASKYVWKIDCLEKFKETVNSTIVSGMLFGHAHTDRFLSSKKMATQFLNPSILPQHHPAFRIYDIDVKGHIKNYIQYCANLEESNQLGIVKYKTQYSAIDYFEIPDLSRKHMHQ